jgi:hypothetical protein
VIREARIFRMLFYCVNKDAGIESHAAVAAQKKPLIPTIPFLVEVPFRV